jgi:hypothetical protein
MIKQALLTLTTFSAFAIFTAAALPQAPTVVYEQGPPVVYTPAPQVVYTQAPVYLQAPVVNIGTRHGNLRNAQSNIVQAYQKIERAQQDNDGQLGGHAQRAKELLIQADEELRLAANVSNAEGR